jgi:hypothetical protein
MGTRYFRYTLCNFESQGKDSLKVITGIYCTQAIIQTK